MNLRSGWETPSLLLVPANSNVLCLLFCFVLFSTQLVHGNTSPNSLFSSTALSNSKGEFLLNGDFVVSMSKREVRVGSAVIEYSGSDNVVERLNSTDRIEEELILQVKTQLLASGSLLLALWARGLLFSFSPRCRCYRWESCTTLMYGTHSTFQLRANLSNSTGTVTGHGKPAASPAKVSAAQKFPPLWVWGFLGGRGGCFIYLLFFFLRTVMYI